MDVRYKMLEEQIFLLNEDEKFYRDYYEAGPVSYTHLSVFTSRRRCK